ncbi:hypothetical protein HOG16_03845 [Candidatus Woesearchaeota archaeon]|jgi:hypothetical protein|nr:hypothetical protein [Candidatus Woesearchaeota archaeon]MBT4321888.1 hypothetical protein [Candidatus Woesearchaeota archaeon]
MNKNFKLLAVLLLLIVAVVSTSVVKASTDDLDYIDIYRVDVNEIDHAEDLDGQPIGPFFAGEKVHVKVYWNAVDNATEYNDVRINAELDDEEYKTNFFTVEEGWERSVSFTFNLPEDMDADDYVLNIEMEDENGNKEYLNDIVLKVVNQKHFVEIYDVNFPYGLEVKAGQTFLANVGVKNVGHEFEEDVKVTLTIPELGLYQRSQKFDLYTELFIDENEDGDDNEWEYKLYKDLFVTIPATTVSGVYDVIVTVNYDDGDESQEQRYSLVVGEGVAPTDAFISINTESQNFAQGNGAVYTIMFSEPNNYDVRVEGVSAWGTARVDVNDDQAYIFVTANEDATAGSYPFTVKVMAGSTVVKEFDLNANINGAQSSTSDVKEGLQIGFAVLLVILIILGIILAAKKIGKSDDFEEPLMDEGETYY